MQISITDVTSSLNSCLEGYVSEVIDSIQVSAGRELTPEEQKSIFNLINREIEMVTFSLNPTGESSEPLPV